MPLVAATLATAIKAHMDTQLGPEPAESAAAGTRLKLATAIANAVTPFILTAVPTVGGVVGTLA